MNIIKLDATKSTNSFLKDLSVNSDISDFTVVVTDKQTSGRGQMNTTWVSEPNKNLLCSIYVKFNDLSITKQVYLNFTIAVAVREALNVFNLPNLEVKWPNDILSGKKKICGILIENILKGNKIDASVIGIGINVNQTIFPTDLPNASSIQSLIGEKVEIEKVLALVIEKLKNKLSLLANKEFDILEKEYHSVLYKKNIPSMFKDDKDVVFMGKILEVDTSNGQLIIELPDETKQSFRLKEVAFI